MDEPTALDLAHAAAGAGEGAGRGAFLLALLEAELFLLLAREADGAAVEPQVFPLEEGPVVLAFDREDRLAAFAGQAVPYAALPGRVLMPLLAARGLGLALNLEVAPSAELLPPEAVAWLVGRLAALSAPVPEAGALAPDDLGPPGADAATLAAALAPALGRAGGLVRAAFLLSAPGPGGAAAPLVAFVGALPGAEGPLARAVAETALLGAGAAAPAVAFLAPGHPLARAAAARGRALPLGRPPPAAPAPPPAPPGGDPARPPILGRRPRRDGV